jgi:hypothetical protein
MTTAGIVIDDWKLPFFTKRLDAGRFKYEEKSGITEDTLTLMVEVEDLNTFSDLVKQMNHDAVISRAN